MIKEIKRKTINIILASILAIGCVGASVVMALINTATNTTIAYANEWKYSNGGWWYQIGKSYAKGWKQIGTT